MTLDPEGVHSPFFVGDLQSFRGLLPNPSVVVAVPLLGVLYSGVGVQDVLGSGCCSVFNVS